MYLSELISKSKKQIDLIDLNYYQSRKVKLIIEKMIEEVNKITVSKTRFNQKIHSNTLLRDKLIKQNKKLGKANSDLVWFRKHFKFEYDKR